MNRVSGGDRIPAQLFKILRDDAVKVLHSTWQQIWETHQWPQDWKKPVFISISKKDFIQLPFNTWQVNPPLIFLFFFTFDNSFTFIFPYRLKDHFAQFQETWDLNQSQVRYALYVRGTKPTFPPACSAAVLRRTRKPVSWGGGGIEGLEVPGAPAPRGLLLPGNLQGRHQHSWRRRSGCWGSTSPLPPAQLAERPGKGRHAPGVHFPKADNSCRFLLDDQGAAQCERSVPFKRIRNLLALSENLSQLEFHLQESPSCSVLYIKSKNSFSFILW